MEAKEDEIAGTTQLKRFVYLCWKCRDVWEEENNEVGIRDASYSMFRKWIFQKIRDQATPTNRPVVDLLIYITKSENLDSCQAEAVSKLLDKTSFSRNYRIARAADKRNGEHSFPVRKILEYLYIEKYHVSWYLLNCRFFTSFYQEKGSEHDLFKTRPCTRLEQLLFVSAIAEITASTICTRRRNINSGKLVSSSHKFPKLGRLNQKLGQRLGWAIQYITISWEMFARSLQFRSLQDMVQPYMKLEKSDVRWTVIPRREDGFAKREDYRSIYDFEPTLRKDESYAEAFERSKTVDSHIRQLTADFLDDVYYTFRCPFLYDDRKLATWGHLHNFSSTDGKIAFRFKAYDVNMCNSIREEISVTNEKQVYGVSPGCTSAREHTKHFSNLFVNTNIESDNQEHSQVDRLKPVPRSKLQKQIIMFDSQIQDHFRMYKCEIEELFAFDDAYSHNDSTVHSSAQLVLINTNDSRIFNQKSEISQIGKIHEMKRIAESAVDMLRCGGHLILFCETLEWKQWKDVLQNINHITENGDTRKCLSVSPYPIAEVKYITAARIVGRELIDRCHKTLLLFHCKKTFQETIKHVELIPFTYYNYDQNRENLELYRTGK